MFVGKSSKINKIIYLPRVCSFSSMIVKKVEKENLKNHNRKNQAVQPHFKHYISQIGTFLQTIMPTFHKPCIFSLLIE